MSTPDWGPPPPLSALDLDPKAPYSRVAARMNRSGHLLWGFPIYRTTYEDDKRWDGFMASLYQHAEESLEECGRRERLQSFFKCPSRVRDVSDARDGAGAEAISKIGAPQYTYCLVVEDMSLSLYKAAASDLWKCGQVPVTLLPAHWHLEEYDGRWVPEVNYYEEGSYQFPETEGTTNPFLDWMLLEQEYITSVYERLIVEDWYDVYVRPPRMYPDEADEAWN